MASATNEMVFEVEATGFRAGHRFYRQGKWWEVLKTHVTKWDQDMVEDLDVGRRPGTYTELVCKEVEPTEKELATRAVPRKRGDHWTLAVVEYTSSRMTIEIPAEFHPQIPAGRYWLRHTPKAGYADDPLSPIYEGADQVVAIECRPTMDGYGQYQHDYKIQAFYLEWESSLRTNAGMALVAIVPEGGYPRQDFEPADLTIDPTRTMEERRRAAAHFIRDQHTEGLVYGGECWNGTGAGYDLETRTFAGQPIEDVPGCGLEKVDHPEYGVIYFDPPATSAVQTTVYGSREAIEAGWLAYAERGMAGYWYGAEPRKTTPASSREWLRKYGPKPDSKNELLRRGCAHTEFHQWNAAR